VEHFRRKQVRVLGLDTRVPDGPAPDEFSQLDVCDPRLLDILREFAPDTVIHGAFIVTPLRDKREMRRVNVDGTKHVLDVMDRIRPARVMLISSATAYGAWPDNPQPMDEDWPLRSRPGFPYAADKTEVEGLIDRFAQQCSDVAVSCVRPSIIGGPSMDNYIRRVLFGMPFLIRMDGHDQPFQLVHERDVVGAIDAILQANGRGAYNVAPPDWTYTSDIARDTGRWMIWLPFFFVRFVYGLGWQLRLPYPETPAGFLYFARYPWLVNPQRLEQEVGYQFEYSTSETLAEILQTRQAKNIR